MLAIVWTGAVAGVALKMWWPSTPRIGRVLIARGHDAADVALSNTFGTNTLTSFRVWADEVPSG